MKKFKRIISILIFFLIILIADNVQADNYSIEEIDMQVTLQENGDLQIDQTLKYNFDGNYNGIYITIPSGVDDSKYDKVRKQTSIVNDSFYNARDIKINKITVGEKVFKEEISAINGQDKVYTIEEENGISKIKLYSPSNNENKTFFISYTLENVAVKHNDIGEIYYNFIGGAWEKTIEKLNIDIHLPNNISKQKLYAFAHGPENGQVTIVDKNTVNLYVENMQSGEYVAGRVLFDLDNISQSTKTSNKIALNTIMQEEQNIYDKIAEKEKINNRLLLLSGILIVYWLFLIFKYDYDKKYYVSSNDEEMFDKYNPLIAGCIQGGRTVQSKDIIAIILELVNKGYLKLEIIQNNVNGRGIIDNIKNNFNKNDNYSYLLSKNTKSTYEPDEIENYVIDWFFRDRYKQTDKEKINLVNELERIPNERASYGKFQELKKMANRKLNSIGVNKAKVPKSIRIINNCIFIFTLIIAFGNIIFNDGNIANSFLNIVGFIIENLPILLVFLVLLFKIRENNNILAKVNGQRLLGAVIGIIVAFATIMFVTAVFTQNKYLITKELLICVGAIIMLTDDLMLKNNILMAEDYSRLNALKYKIENYSMIEEKEIKEVVLWERYLTYAISFGIAKKIASRIKTISGDSISRLMDNDKLYEYISDDYKYFNRQIIRNRKQTLGTYSGSNGSGGFSRGSGGGFTGGGGFSGGGGRGRWRRSFLKNKYKIWKNISISFLFLRNMLKYILGDKFV